MRSVQFGPVAKFPVEVAEQLAAVTVALVERLKNLATELMDHPLKLFWPFSK